jgi:hypothetical protein
MAREASAVVKQLVGVLFVATAFWPAAPEAAQKSGTPTVGSTIKTRDAAVTLHAYREVVTSRRSTETVPAGSAVTAIDVEICNRSTGVLPVRRSQFFIGTPDAPLVFPSTFAAPRPQLNTKPVARHRCLRGWVSYVVPTGTRATSAIYQAGAMFTNTLHRWQIPKA